MASQTVNGPRMQTNAAWQSPSVSFRSGSPTSLVDISAWTLDGVAVGEKGARVHLNTTNSRIVFDSANAFHVDLSADDMKTLGVGEVVIEIMRRDPDPVRPLLRIAGVSKRGIA